MYGYPRETMPNLARFAQLATVYHNHIAGGNFTSSGTASLLTGTNPFTHKAYQNYSQVKAEFKTKNVFSLFDHYFRLAYTHNPLVQVFFDQFLEGIDLFKQRQELFIGNSAVTKFFAADEDIATLSWHQWNSRQGDRATGSLFMPDFEGYLQNRMFELYSDQYPRGLPEVKGMGYFLMEHAIDWVMQQMAEVPRPYLFYVHLLPPHHPYNTRNDFVDRFDDGWDPLDKPNHFLSSNFSPDRISNERRYYDEFIAFVDAEFGRLYEWMQSNGMLDDTWIIFTTDHGEIFERGMIGHINHVFHQPLLHIPLLIHAPGQTQQQDIYQPTNAVDVLPTLLHITQQPVPDWLEGQVLPPHNQQSITSDCPFLAFDGREFAFGDKVTKGTAVILRWPYKLTYYWRYQRMKDDPEYIELFDVEADPEELHNLSREKRQTASDLLAELKEHIKRSGRITFPE